jgi:hypothetical protein
MARRPFTNSIKFGPINFEDAANILNLTFKETYSGKRGMTPQVKEDYTKVLENVLFKFMKEIQEHIVSNFESETTPDGTALKPYSAWWGNKKSELRKSLAKGQFSGTLLAAMRKPTAIIRTQLGQRQYRIDGNMKQPSIIDPKDEREWGNKLLSSYVHIYNMTFAQNKLLFVPRSFVKARLVQPLKRALSDHFFKRLNARRREAEGNK